MQCITDVQFGKISSSVFEQYYWTKYLQWNHFRLQSRQIFGRSPGLVDIGGHSCIKGRGFESQHCKLDIFSNYFVVKSIMFVRKYKNKRKRGRGGPIFLKKISKYSLYGSNWLDILLWSHWHFCWLCQT